MHSRDFCLTSRRPEDKLEFLFGSKQKLVRQTERSAT